MSNRVSPEDEQRGANVSWGVPATSSSASAQEADEPLTDDEPAEDVEKTPSKFKGMVGAASSWLLGEKPRKLDADDIQEGRSVTAFAKQLIPAMKEASTSHGTLTAVKVTMFIGLNTLLVAMLFVYPIFNTYHYLGGEPKIVDGSVIYDLSQSMTYNKVPLLTADDWEGPVPEDNPEQLATYDTLVSLPFDAAGDPGWNLQDLLDLPRVTDEALQYSGADGGRLVQDYRRCTANCLDAGGRPADMTDSVTGNPSRNFTERPYGAFGDYYVRREVVLAALDQDYYQQYLNSSMTAGLRSSRGNFGFPDDSDAQSNTLNSTVPTEGGYLCNLGRPRKQLQAIQINSKSCYIKIFSAPGDGYELFLRTGKDAKVDYAVAQTEATNSTSGCRTFTLDITAQAADCSRPQLIGVDSSCELSCALILFKGINARRVPIKVVESTVAGTWPSTLHINDKYLVLDQGTSSKGLPDLQVTGGGIIVNITSARIGSLSVQNTAGPVTLDHARVDNVFVNSTTDNVVIEDDRDTELLYRSAGNLLCAAAPLVEAIPDAFLGCFSNSSKPHNWYEVTQDGAIDRNEFTAGLAKMGLSFQPDSLNLDEQQQTLLLQTVFKDGPSVSDRVALTTFDSNLQQVKQLDFMADSYGLLDPNCYSGRFLKVRPTYTAAGTDNAARIAAAAADVDGSGTVVDTRMPAYAKSATNSALNPCPAEWGTGTQGSTNFTHFKWANSTLGYKWGKALPAWCMDEACHSGGVDGKYPEDKLTYGALAGQPILPGCEPSACKPVYKVVATAGSIHAQVLPFRFDAVNATGDYQTMVAECEDSDGQSRCFYKGWADDADATVHSYDVPAWQALMDPCYADSLDCSDTVQAVTVTGQGAPMHQKWFWSSRKVYLQLEPAWYLVMSGTLLKPDISHVNMRLSPGYCSATLGAVEHIDWRHSSRFDALVSSANSKAQSSASGVTHIAAPSSELTASSRIDPRDAVLAQQGLRASRGQQVIERLQACINGSAPDRAGWFLKQSIRQDYRNESLALSPVTADGNLDTDPGHLDAAGKLQGTGPAFRHKRVCVPGRNCRYEYMVYRDNCQVPRTASVDPTTHKATLSPCTFPDGSSAWLDPILQESAPTFNDTYYAAQFPWPAGEYGLDQLQSLKGDQLLLQALLADANSHQWDNVSVPEYSKWSLQVAEDGDLKLVDASDAWRHNTPLYCAIILSLVIAAMCSLLVVAMLVYTGLSMLKKINIELQARAKIEVAVLEERKAAMFAEVLEVKRYMVREARKRAAQLVRNTSKLEQHGGGKGAGGPDMPRLAEEGDHVVAAVVISAPAGAAKAAHPAAAVDPNVGDVFLTEAEKLEILRVWDNHGYSTTDFRNWDKNELIQAWLDEVQLRNLPADNPTLLLDNIPIKTSKLATLRKMITFKKRADIAINDAGPFNPTKNKTLDAAALAANPVKLHKVESKLRYEDKMNKLQQQFSKRTSKETQALLKKQGSSAGPVAATDGSKKPMVEPDWRIRLQQLAAINAERLKRLAETLVQMCMINLPSPFKVINDAVVDLFQSMLVDSLLTFFQVKCLFDHDMSTGEEVMLGQCELARTQLGLGAGKAVKPAASTNPTGSPNAKSGASASGDAPASATAEAEVTLIELDGEGDVVACTAVDGKVEMYRVKYVRMTLKSSMIQVPADESDSDDDSSDEEPEEDSHTGDAGGTGAKPSGLAGWGKNVKNIGKTFAKVTAVAAFMSMKDDSEEDARKLFKKRRQWQLLIEEGPGVVTSSKYRPELEPLAPGGDNKNMAGTAAPLVDNSKQLMRRTICLPCPSKKEMHLLAQNELPTAGRVRHYVVATPSGNSVITVDTLPATADKDMLPGGKQMPPRVQFSAPLSSFTPHYEKFCMENDLQAKDVLASNSVLASANISLKKRVIGKIKGLKQKAANVDSAEELAGLGEDSCLFPGQAGAAANSPGGFDPSEDGAEASESGAGGHRLAARAAAHSLGAAASRLPPLRAGGIPSFPGDDDSHSRSPTASSGGAADLPGSANNRSSAGGATAAAAARASRDLQGYANSSMGAHRSTMEGDSDEDEENEQSALLGAQGSSLAVATAANRVSGGGLRKSGSRRSTRGDVAATAAEAKAAEKADKKKPSWKLMQLLQASQEPLAVFLRETYEITGNFVADEVDIEIMQRQYRRWSRTKGHSLSMAGAAAAPEQAGPRSQAGLAVEGSAIATPAAVHLSSAAVVGAAGKLTGDQVAAFGFKYQQAPEHTMFGVLVNPQDFNDDPRDANRLVYLAAELVCVIMHTVFIWMLPIPLFVIVFGFQGYYNVTTSIQPMLTIDSFRANPLSYINLQFYPLLEALIWISIIWVFFCYIKLMCHYLLTKYEDRPWRAVLKTLFWAYLTVMIAVLVAYVFEVFCWVILGAVINPNKFLPYSVAAITLVAHAKATWQRLITKFNSYREALSQNVMGAFQGKIEAAGEATAQTENLLQQKLAEVSASDAVRTPASLPGLAGEPSNHDAAAGMLGIAAGAVGMGLLGAVAGSAIASKSAARRVWPGFRRSSNGDKSDKDSDDEGAGRRGGSDGGAKQQRRSDASNAGGQLSIGGGYVAKKAGSNAGARSGSSSGAAGSGGGKGSSGGGQSKPGKSGELECYDMFKMFAADDDTLDYAEFCALLEHLDIRLLEEKRRKLFARLDKSGDSSIGYTEFQEGFDLLKQQIVERHMTKKGITIGRLVCLLAYAVVILLLIFVFIFLGVAAFTGANTMGAVVNSCMTAGAGLAMNLKGGNDDEDEEKEDVDLSDA